MKLHCATLALAAPLSNSGASGTRGATSLRYEGHPDLGLVSIHAPARGATVAAVTTRQRW
ncbi:hypothetical protein [Vineibacter terrae]|uniref:hypothetical protein n=1 Tax=Vineibacter terrae TaxID=2586908 RepID=UPI002E327F9A|nr:hypothetical protein [Vineibacter terrae]HEX2891551.1 hypothetical protein [Vineibacter terrae]